MLVILTFRLNAADVMKLMRAAKVTANVGLSRERFKEFYQVFLTDQNYEHIDLNGGTGSELENLLGKTYSNGKYRLLTFTCSYFSTDKILIFKSIKSMIVSH